MSGVLWLVRTFPRHVAYSGIGATALAATCLTFACGSGGQPLPRATATPAPPEPTVAVWVLGSSQPPQITTYPSAAEAASAAEKASGAAIPLGSPPAGYRLVSLTILPMPPFPTSGLPTRIEARYEKGSEWFKLLYVGSRFQFPGDESPANRLPAPTAGQDLYRVTAGPLVEYTLLTADRGFIVTLPTPGPISEAEAIRILSSVTK